MDRKMLRDDQWARIEALCSGKASERGVTGRDNRLFVEAAALIEGIEAQSVIADKGYDADAFIATIESQGAQAVIPPRSNRLTQRAYDRYLYKDRNLVERLFNRLKQFRRIATRYEKLSQNFMSMLNLACAYIWLA